MLVAVQFFSRKTVECGVWREKRGVGEDDFVREHGRGGGGDGAIVDVLGGVVVQRDAQCERLQALLHEHHLSVRHL